MYKIIVLILTICFTRQLMSYPIFGTKRYHRTPAVSSPGILSSKNNPTVSYYNELETYYDTQPSSSLSSYGSGPISFKNNNNNNNNNNNYQLDDKDDDNFYYYPSTKHEYQHTIYGLPTYHGDYKPKPYYYAPGPKYSNYDDREIASNPMDDLHEEILHEDQRDRQREFTPMYGQENWYQTGHATQNDVLTNNFVKNLIEYNRHMDAQEKLRKQREEEEAEEERQRLLYQRDNEQYDKPYQYEKPYGDYEEYAEIDDYEYEPQPSENVFDIKKYEQLRTVTEKPTIQPTEKPTIKYPDNDDENVLQLKSLALTKPTTAPIKHEEDYNFDWKTNNQPQPQTFKQYDNEPEEYDDDAWISWDRKRSESADNKWKTVKMKIKAIKAFNNRKPFAPVSKELQDELMLKKLASSATVSPTPELTKTLENNEKQMEAKSNNIQNIPSTTATLSKKLIADSVKSGQKEVVVPRPSNGNPQKIFSSPVLRLMNSKIDSKVTDEDEVMDLHKEDDDGEKSNYFNSKLKTNPNIYNTIKQIIAMENQLENIPTANKLHKRFIASEDNLVHQLDNLKRTSV